MSGVTSKDIEGIVGPDTGVAGHVAGLGVHYDISKTDPKVSGQNVEVALNLNEKSLQRAEKNTGVTRTPKPGAHKPAAAMSAASKKGEKADDAYAGMFDKRRLSSRVGMSARPNYRAAMTTPGVGPLARVKNRRMYQLRRAFDQIAAHKNKTALVKTENLPQEALKKIVMAAIQKGETMTPVGSLSRAMKLAGIKPKNALEKQTQKKRQWALFVDPNLIPTGWAMD